MDLSARVKELSPSLTLEVKSKVDQLRENGVKVIDLGIGAPDFYTAENVKNAAHNAIKSNFTKYTAASGIQELKEAIVAKYIHEYDLSYKTSEVIISAGAKQVLFNIALVLFDPGDEVILPSPYWTSFPEPIKLAGAKPVVLETKEEHGFIPKAAEVARMITKKTKALIINSPANPTGAVIQKDELRKLAELASKRGFYIISDEIYEKFVYEGGHTTPAEFNKEKVILVNSVSKTYAMTGWRIGFALGPKKLIDAMSRLQSHSTSCPSSISQMAALEALRGDQSYIDEVAKIYRRRRDFIVGELNSIPEIRCAIPHGAFYAFPNISSLLRCEIENSVDFARYLLEEAQVAVVPGEAFGRDGYIRISYATSMENLEEGMQRIKSFRDNRLGSWGL